MNIKSFIPNLFKRKVKLIISNCTHSFFYYFFDKGIFDTKYKNKKIKRIMFVCKGNVCRSVFAEVRLRNLIDCKSVSIESCGLDVDQGDYPPRNSIEVAHKYHCKIEKHKSKSVNECNLADYDLILAMEYTQYKRLIYLVPEKKSAIRLLREFCPLPLSIFCNIYDPYGWSIEEYKKSYKIINLSLQNLSKEYGSF